MIQVLTLGILMEIPQTIYKLTFQRTSKANKLQQIDKTTTTSIIYNKPVVVQLKQLLLLKC